jgi:hypothetical protein
VQRRSPVPAYVQPTANGILCGWCANDIHFEEIK